VWAFLLYYYGMKTEWLNNKQIKRGDWILLHAKECSTVMSVEKCNNAIYVRTTSGDFFPLKKFHHVQKILCF